MPRSISILLSSVRAPFQLQGLALVFASFALMTTQARAAQDVVHFGESIEVGKDAAIHDAVCFFCAVNVQGTVRGDVVSFFGDVQMDGHADHDVVNFFGNVKVANEASIGHNLVSFFGDVWLGEYVTVGRDAVVMFGNMHSAPSATFGGDRVVEPGCIFWGPFLLAALGIAFFGHEVRRQRRMRFVRGF